MDLVEIYRTPHERSCRDRALVLSSQGIRFAREQRDGFCVLLVDARFADFAADQLRRYEEENHGFGRALREILPPAAAYDDEGTIVFAGILILFALFQLTGAFEVHWVERGASVAGLTRLDQPWRALTALMLHAELAHLAANLFFGSLFGYLVAYVHGGGLGYLAILVAGFLGNWTNAWIQPAEHGSIGASTAFFGAVGILCASEARRRHLLDQESARRIAPLGVAVVLLAYLGVSGERTDVLAHVCGLAWGLILGVFLPELLARGALRRSVQVACGGAALALIALAWGLAIFTSPAPA